MHEEKEITTTKPQSTTEPELKRVIEDVIHQHHTSRTHPPTYCCPEDESVYDRLLVRMLVEKLTTPASTAPVVDEGSQKMFPPPAEDKLHIAICNAVQSDQFTASDILRQALLDYQPTQLTRSELIRVQQRSGSDEVSAIMVSPAAATAAPHRTSSDTWGRWFERLGDKATAEIVNATADLVTDERLAALVDAKVLPAAAPVQQSNAYHVCIICKVEPVCPEEGFDTCSECAKNI